MGGGGTPSHVEGDPIQLLKRGEGVITLSQVAFYCLNMNGYRNIIFSVSLLLSQVGGDGTPSHVGGPHSTLEEGGRGGNIIPDCFLLSEYEWLWESNIFSQTVVIPGGGGPYPTWGGPHPLYMWGCSLICSGWYLYSVQQVDIIVQISNIFVFAVFRNIFRSSIKIMIQ